MIPHRSQQGDSLVYDITTTLIMRRSAILAKSCRRNDIPVRVSSFLKYFGFRSASSHSAIATEVRAPFYKGGVA